MSAKNGVIFLMLSCLLPVLLSCGSDDPLDCVVSAGEEVMVELSLGAFTKIRTENDVGLLIKEGPRQQIILKSRKHLADAIEVEIIDGILAVRNTSTCNFIRDYGLSQLVVTTPNITEIRNASSYEVASEGILTFPSLTLVSDTSISGVEQINKSGDFFITINNDKVVIVANGKSFIELKGNSQLLDVRFNDENPRLEAGELVAQDVKFFHRSANKMIVNPQLSLTGIITGTGDVIAVKRPAMVEVEQRFRGKLIFKEQ